MAVLPPKITIVVDVRPGNAAAVLEKILEECHALDAAAEERIAAEPHMEMPDFRVSCPRCGSSDPAVRIQNAAGQPCPADWHPANRPAAPELREDLKVRARVATGISSVLDGWRKDPYMRTREEQITGLTDAVMSQLGRDAPGS